VQVVYGIPNLTQKTAVALGAFDGLHIGHMQLIYKITAYAKKHGLQSCVFTFLKSPSGAKYLTNQRQREQLLFKAGVDLLVLQPFTPQFKHLEPEAFFKAYLLEGLNAAFVTAGFNFFFGKDRAGDAALLTRLCRESLIECSIVPPVKQDGLVVSSTQIRSLVEAGSLKEAARMLGRWYEVEGVVEKGDQIGRTIGFPTANIPVDSGRMMPPRGVYASFTHWRGKQYPGITNFGGKPTVRPGVDMVETYLFDFSQELYGESIQVSFVERLRDIRPFESLEALSHQLEADKARARTMLADLDKSFCSGI
jgi:riboflavin kinase/FMN adenylyltransferase